MIRYRGPEGEREVRYGKTDLSLLRSEWLKAQDECDALNGAAPKPRRFAMTFRQGAAAGLRTTAN